MTQPSSWTSFNPLKWVADVAAEEQLKIDEERRKKTETESSSQISYRASSSTSVDPYEEDFILVEEEEVVSFRSAPPSPPKKIPSPEADSLLQIAWKTFTSLLRIPDSVKERFTRIVPIGNEDANPFSVDVTDDSEQITQAIVDQIDEIRSDQLPAEIIPAAPSADSVKKNQNEDPVNAILTENREITDTELEKFQPVIIAYVIFRLLDWVADNQPPHGTEKDPTIYQRMVARAIKSPSEEGTLPLSLWQIYQEEMGANLNSFSRAKAWICYLLFYEKTNIVPSLIEALTKSTLEGFRKPLLAGKAIDLISSTTIDYTETYLNIINGGINNYIKTAGASERQDVYKKMALEKRFDPEKLDELIKECSSKAIRLFFPHISFCNVWENHASSLLQTLGWAISSLVNGLLNPIIKISLEKIMLPYILRSAIDNFTSSDPEQDYLFTRGLYSVTTEKLKEIYDKINNPPEESEETSSEEMTEIDNLVRVSKLLTEVLTLPPNETSKGLKKFQKALEKNPNDVHEEIQIGISKAGKIVLDILHKPEIIENLFANLLKVSRTSLCTPSESFKKLKEDHERSENELHTISVKLFDTFVDQAIEAMVAPRYETLEKRTKAVLSQTKKETASLLSNPQELIATIEKTATFIDDSFSRSPTPNKDALSPEMGFQAIRDFCNLIQDLNQQLDLKDIAAKHPNLSAAQKKSFDRALQPIREKLLALAKLLSRLNKEQNTHYLCIRAHQPMRDLHMRLEKIHILLEERKTDSLPELFRPIESYLEETAFFSARLHPLEPEALAPLEECHTNLSEMLKIAQKEGKIIAELLSLIEKGEEHQSRKKLIPLVDQLVHSPLSEDIKEITENILIRANINRPPFISMIDQMGMHVFPEWRKNWNWDRFQEFILEQIEVGHEPLREALIEKFKRWQHIPRGEHAFPVDRWLEEAREFVQTTRGDENKKSLSLLLSQIESFLRDDSIINVQWNYFCQHIRREIEIRKQKQARAIEAYQDDLSLSAFVEKQVPIIQSKQEPTHNRIKEILEEIKLKTADLIHAASTIEFEKSYAPTDVITAGLGLGGALLGGLVALAVAGGLLPASVGAAALGGGIMSLADWFNPKQSRAASGVKGAVAGMVSGAVLGPAGPVLTGAAGGIYAGKKALKNAKGYGKKNVTPEINKVFKNAMKELGKPYTKSTIVYATLEAFSGKSLLKKSAFLFQGALPHPPPKD